MGSVSKPFDFDHDGKADLSVWQPGNGNWIIKQSSNGATVTQPDWGRGSLGDKLVPADYDGDGKTDKAIFRPSDGNWYILNSSTNIPIIKNWGGGSDIPVPGDYDGDGKADVAVYRPSESNWYIKNSSNNSTRVQGWGNLYDVPVPGDYDGDGRMDIAVVRPLEGNWYILKSSSIALLVQWGGIGDKLVPADYDGDGKTDVAVFRTNEGNWYIKQSSTGNNIVLGWGDSTDIPVPADYDGNGTADLAVYRPSEGNWYIRNYPAGAQGFGVAGDVPVPSAFLKNIMRPPPQTPVAIPGGPYNAANASAVQLNGGGSYDPDGTIASYSWNFGDNTTGTGRTPTHIYATAGSYTVTLTVTDNSGSSSSPASATVTVADFTAARLDPSNRTGQAGDDSFSHNFNWRLPLVSLPGRSGLDLGLALSYNSLVWLKSGDKVAFDLDNGFPGPGFRLGFPVLQPKYHNSQTNQDAYLLIMPSGNRVELRRVGVTNTYMAADSSYLQLNASSMVITSGDGTQLSYAPSGNQYQCTRVMDRNGNYITVNYNSSGQIITIIDTLERKLTFNYDSTDNRLTSITQPWAVNGQTVAHTWARFTYKDDLVITTSFNNLTVIGPQNGTTLPVLERVWLDDGSSYKFSYSLWGQVYRVTRYAADSQQDSHPLAYINYNLNNSGPQDDCPRFTERRDWAESWNDNQEAVTSYSIPVNASWTMPSDNTSQTGTVSQITTPDGTYYKMYSHASGWDKGLAMLTETYGADKPGDQVELQRWAATKWSQDDPAVAYLLNPRIEESNVGDTGGNLRRTVIAYKIFTLPSGASCRLPEDVAEYDGASIYRHVQTDYVLSSTYLNQSLIGLVGEQRLYAGTGTRTLSSKVSYQYDEAGYLVDQASVLRHDAAYGINFTQGRGNLTSVHRWDANNPSDISKSVISRTGYNIAGSIVFERDPLWQPNQPGHQANISYADDFSVVGNRNTFAFPTTVTDADGYSSTAKYNYDFGAATQTQTPPPEGFTTGPIQTMEYDAIGRLIKSSNSVNGAYTKWNYPTSQTTVETFTKVNAEDPEDAARSFKVLDGAGRVRATATALPNGNYAGQLLLYDVMGRVVRQSNPTETNATGTTWAAVGDDAATGWVYTTQIYDWKSRPLVTSKTADGATTTSEMLYDGCGCAGGETVLTRDEVGRRQRVSYDRFGRAWRTQMLYAQPKSEALNGAGDIYSTVTNTYNERDQLTKVYQETGAPGNGVGQTTTMTYDGHGRLSSQHVPQQTANTATNYLYNTDDTMQQTTDARGVVASFSYNGRGLMTHIAYEPGTSGVADTPDVSFAYDAAGNRTAMTDAAGNVAYQYDRLSRLSAETRTFTDINRSYTLTYGYNLAGAVTSITDASNAQLGYHYDRAGRLSSINGAGFAQVSQYLSGLQYRAWGGLKAATYGNGRTLALNYNARLQVSHFEIPQVLAKDYQYDADGRLRYSQDLLDPQFDRTYSYDHVGRLQEALSGVEARGGVAASGAQRPYKQSYGYDALGHLTTRASQHWTASYSLAQSYLNDRNTHYLYDAAGHIINDTQAQYSYDAAGQLTVVTAITEAPDEQLYDGDGQRVKLTAREYSAENNQTYTTVNYYVRSSVLGGQVLTELDAQGEKRRGYVYWNGEVLAWQQHYTGSADSVVWEQRDAAGASARLTDQAGYVYPSERRELDAVGADAGVENPYPAGPVIVPTENESLLSYPSYGNPANQQVSYSRDGMPISTAEAMDLLNSRPSGAGFTLLYASAAQSRRVVGTRTYTAHWSVRRYETGTNVQVGYRNGYESRTEAIYDGAWSWTSTIHPLPPQRPTPTSQQTEARRLTRDETTALRKRIADMVAEHGCADFIKTLLQTAEEIYNSHNANNPLVSTDALKLFDIINSQGGYNYDASLPYNTVKGKMADSSASVWLLPRSSYGPGSWPGREEYVTQEIAFSGFHETFHEAGKSVYTDQILAQAILKMPIPHDVLPTGDITSGTLAASLNASFFWNHYLYQYCYKGQRK